MPHEREHATTVLPGTHLGPSAVEQPFFLMHVSWGRREEGGGRRDSTLQGVMICAVVSVSDFGGFTGTSGVVTVNVTTADDKDQVALECPVAESDPPLKLGGLEMETLSQRTDLTINCVF